MISADKIQSHHRSLKALVYLRQSTPKQVVSIRSVYLTATEKFYLRTAQYTIVNPRFRFWLILA